VRRGACEAQNIVPGNDGRRFRWRRRPNRVKIIGPQPPNRRATLDASVRGAGSSDPPSPDHDSGAVFRVPGSAFNRAGDLAGCVMAQKLFIGGLAFSTSTERLREVFAQAGVVESAAVVMDRETGRSRGFGFVEMATVAEADSAIKKFNGQELDGRTLKVEHAKPAGQGGGSRTGGGQGRNRW